MFENRTNLDKQNLSKRETYQIIPYQQPTLFLFQDQSFTQSSRVDNDDTYQYIVQHFGSRGIPCGSVSAFLVNLCPGNHNEGISIVSIFFSPLSIH